MKTPKRYPATMSVYLTSQDLKNDRARWKRKNKIKQLKRTITSLYDALDEADSTLSKMSHAITRLHIRILKDFDNCRNNDEKLGSLMNSICITFMVLNQLSGFGEQSRALMVKELNRTIP